MSERSELIASRPSASEAGGDGVRGRSPRETMSERSELIASRPSASEAGGDGVRGRSPRETKFQVRR
jgi:hypothetical protein